MTILNFTQHPATKEQLAAGVINLGLHHDLVYLKELLTFTSLPTSDDVYERAYAIAELAQGMFAETVMIGGAPFLMPYLQAALQKRGITVVYAFSERVSTEEVIDGTVFKKNTFKHAGFVEVFV